MIAITGANGQLGRLVIEALLTKVPGNEVIATVRSPEKGHELAAKGVQIRVADYDRPETLETAFAGVDRLLLISSNALGMRLAQHKAVIDAAKRAGVKLVAYTSLLHADRSPLGMADEHRQTEAYLQNSGMSFVLLRNGWYAENFAARIAAALQHKALFGSAGEGRISWASRADYAEAAAAVLTTDVDQAGRVYELAGDQAYTLAELAGEVARQSGAPVVYENLPEAAYKEMLVDAGVPEVYASLLAQADADASQGGLFDDGCEISRLTGCPTATLAQSIGEALAPIVQQAKA